MSDRWGYYWRWRAVLLLATVCLLGYGWVLADQWRLRKVVAGSGNPAALYIERRNGVSIEAYDWKAGKRWQVADVKNAKYVAEIINSLRVVGDGEAIAWHEGTTIHVVDLAPPHEHRQYDTSIKNPDDWFVGLTDDERFAVFQTHGERVPAANGGTELVLRRPLGKRGVIVHRVVDLKTGMVVDTREWASTLSAIGPNGFLSDAALWKISAAGKLVKFKDRDARFSHASGLSLAGNQQGRWRLLDDISAVGLDEEPSSPSVVRISPSGEHVLATEMTTSRMFLVNTRTKAVRLLPVSYPALAVGEFVDDGKAILMPDLRDDIRVIDAQTGKLLAIDGAGAQRRNRLFAVAAMLALASAILLGTAIWERQFHWAIADVAASFVAAQEAVGYALIGFVQPEMYFVWPGARFLVLPVALYLVGMFIGAATMMGIYWAFGRGWLLGRWLLGCLGLCAFALPLIAVWELGQGGENLSIVIGVVLAFGLVFASAANCIGVFVRALGWTLRDLPVEENPRQYRLATFFLIVAAIAVLIVVGQWLFVGPRALQIVSYAVAGVAMIASAMILAGILLSHAKAWLLVCATALLACAVVAGIYVHGENPMGGSSRYEIYLLEGPTALATAITVAIPCLVLRSRNWRWRRGRNGVVAARPIRDRRDV